MSHDWLSHLINISDLFWFFFFSISFRVHLPFRNGPLGKSRTNAKLWVLFSFRNWVEIPSLHPVTFVFMSICCWSFQSLTCNYSLNPHLFLEWHRSLYTYRLSYPRQKSIIWQWNFGFLKNCFFKIFLPQLCLWGGRIQVLMLCNFVMVYI